RPLHPPAVKLFEPMSPWLAACGLSASWDTDPAHSRSAPCEPLASHRFTSLVSSPTLMKLCAASGLHVAEREFAGSLFHELDKPHSAINVLIGSKKFTEGWSSWRVSTMGLMNVGRSEGAQIIQLFGRGVRLKG